MNPGARSELGVQAKVASVNESRLQRNIALIRRHADLFVALGLIALLLAYFELQRLPLQLNDLDDFDLAWAADLVAKAQQHVWLGKQVVFTYGPLFQWLLAAITRARGNSLGDFYLSLWVFQYVSLVAGLYAAGAIFLRRRAVWKRSFCLLLLVIFWAPVFVVLFDFKVLLPVICLGIFLEFLSSASNSRALIGKAALSAALIVVSFLFSADSGAYALAALVIAGIWAGCSVQRKTTELVLLGRFCLWAALFGGLWMLTVNAILDGVGDFHFWRGSYEMLSVYRWSQAMAMSSTLTPEFFFAIAICVSIFLVALARQKRNEQPRRFPSKLWPMLALGLLMLESAIVVGERFHAALSLLPLIMLSCYVLFGATEETSGWRPLWPVVTACVLTGIFSGPNHVFLARNLTAGFKAANQVIPCSPGTFELDGVCLKQSTYKRLTTVSQHLQRVSSPQDAVAIFPYQNIYGVLAQRRVAGAVLQNYAVAGDWLTDQQLQSYENAPFALFANDDYSSIALDGVPNFTRSPQVWLELQREYRAVDQPDPGTVIAVRDPARARDWRATAMQLPIQAGKYEVSGGKEILLANWFPARFDFLRVQCKLDYPAWWRLLKPAQIEFTITFPSGASKHVLAIAQPGRESEIWIYPWRDADLLAYFDPDEGKWRNEGAQIYKPASLALKFSKRDWASVLPRSVEIREVDAVSLSENQNRDPSARARFASPARAARDDKKK